MDPRMYGELGIFNDVNVAFAVISADTYSPDLLFE